MIEAKNVSKVFRVHRKEPGLKASVRSLFHREWIDKEALKGVSLEVKAGEIVGLVGANGAGKTTLVKILSGIIHPSSGEVKVLGYAPWERRNEFRRQIALIMGQKAQLWWDLPAADCFLLLREIYRIPRLEFEQGLERLTSALGVREQLKIQVRRLSLGERMKMELIAALLHRPKVVYLDEPTIGLDLMAQRSIREFLLEYRREHAPAMLLTSHYMEDIERLCERILIIREGALVYDGSLDRIVKDFAKHKIVIARLARALGPGATAGISKLGELSPMEPGGDTLRLKVDRDRVPEAAQAILRDLPVADLSIEEEDIGTVIEEILKSGGKPKGSQQ